MQLTYCNNSLLYNPDTALASWYFHAADSLFFISKYDSSSYYFQKAKVIYENMHDWVKIIRCNNEIAWNQKVLGRLSDAYALYQTNINIGLSYLGENHPATAATYSNLGTLYEESGFYEKAMEYYQKSLNIVLSIKEYPQLNIASIYNNIAEVYRNTGDYYTAKAYYENGLSLYLKYKGTYWHNTALVYNNIGLTYFEMKEYDKALELLKKSLDIRLVLFDSLHQSVAESYNNLGITYLEKGDNWNAHYYLQKSHDILVKALSDSHPIFSYYYNNLAAYYSDNKKYAEAIRYYNKALEICTKYYDPLNPMIADLQLSRGLIFYNTGNIDSALNCFQKTINSLIENYKSDDIYNNPLVFDDQEGKGNKIISKTILLKVIIAKASTFESIFNKINSE